ncbi:MAG: 30S ribosomal protein S16 [Coriobacteriia bacterium]|nr:30S ribosomal protein S16 [Coriobacteriia bacterium]
MVRIRLSRHGAKKRPYYRIVVADQRRSRDGKFIDEVGRYNPCVEPAFVDLKMDKIKSWIERGAQPTDIVSKLIKGNDGSAAKKPAAKKAEPKKEEAPKEETTKKEEPKEEDKD